MVHGVDGSQRFVRDYQQLAQSESDAEFFCAIGELEAGDRQVSLAALPDLRVHWIIAQKIVAELLEPGLPCRVLPLGLAPALPSVAALTVLVASTTNGSFQ